MHVLFIHKVFPAQLGHIARNLAKRAGWQCTYVTERLPTTMPGVGPVEYIPDFGSGTQLGRASSAPTNPQFFQFAAAGAPAAQAGPRVVEGIRLLEYEPVEQQGIGFDSLVTRGHTVYQLLKAHPEIRPDLVVGSTIYASSMFLPELYECPVINYCDYYYHRNDSFVDFRPEFPPGSLEVCRARATTAWFCSTCVPARPATVRRPGSETFFPRNIATRSPPSSTASIGSCGIVAIRCVKSATIRRFRRTRASSLTSPVAWNRCVDSTYS